MTELIAIIILLSSVVGMGVIIFRKIPVLLTLPEMEIKKGEDLILRLKKIIGRINPFKNFSFLIFLEKILRKIRILTLKTDNKTFNWLRKLKEKYQKKPPTHPPAEIEKKDNYWEEIKKIKKNEK